MKELINNNIIIYRMAKIIKLSSYKTLIKNPKLSELYDKYDDITDTNAIV